MSTALAQVIGSALVLLGTIITVRANQRKTEKGLNEFTQVNLYRLDQLEKKQEQYNNVIKRTYELEKTVAIHTEQIKELNESI